MLLPLACLACVVVAFGVCGRFLVKDRNFWRNEYRSRDREAQEQHQALVKESREREQHLFDQLLRVKGFRATAEPILPQPAVARAPALDADDLAVIDDRINERVEAGIMTPSEGWMLASEVRSGAKTTKEVDQILWKRSHTQQEFAGSVADID